MTCRRNHLPFLSEPVEHSLFHTLSLSIENVREMISRQIDNSSFAPARRPLIQDLLNLFNQQIEFIELDYSLQCETKVSDGILSQLTLAVLSVFAMFC